MDISVELTLTPLQDNYEELIINFIKKIRDSGFTIRENPLSTQIYGDYDEVMNLLNIEIKLALELMENGLMYIKIVKSDRSHYEPNI